jgi:NAD+ synthase (glutamine-hydrolysing)
VDTAPSNFADAYAHGFARVAAVTLPVTPADPAANARAVIEQARACHADSVAVAVFPELCLSGYSIDDLMLQQALLEAVERAIAEVVAASTELSTVLVVGAPIIHQNRVLNAAVVIHRGVVLGVSAKSYLPTYREFYERRWFGSGVDIEDEITVAGQPDVPLSTRLIYRANDIPGLTFHAEICEDMWVPVPPSAIAALAGATVLLNLSASPVTVGRAESRRLLVASASARCSAAYVYTAAGAGESTTDLAWDGQAMIYELGGLLAESERFNPEAHRTVADVDLEQIRAERLRQGTFDDNARAETVGEVFRVVDFQLGPQPALVLKRPLDRFPFVPDDPDRLQQDCYEAYNIQVSGLVTRLKALPEGTKAVIGISGGLDSTHALIVAADAMDRLGRPRSDILAFTMPGFATTDRTKGSALALMDAIGATAETLDITTAATQMMKDLGQSDSTYDVTFENIQAGLRTDYLFRIANQRHGIVIGTGDLSELALGWCTYGVGDQMSHYNVNAGVPKTLIQHLIRWVISTDTFTPETNAVLRVVVDQEISPELIPGSVQSTEATVGPYALQDFTLFHVVRHGFRPSKIAFLAQQAWGDMSRDGWPIGYPEDQRRAYDLDEIVRWMRVFITRFFASQFKRSALPNGPKVSNGGTMSPRGDWRMPSDAKATAWLAELEANVPVGQQVSR